MERERSETTLPLIHKEGNSRVKIMISNLEEIRTPNSSLKSNFHSNSMVTRSISMLPLALVSTCRERYHHLKGKRGSKPTASTEGTRAPMSNPLCSQRHNIVSDKLSVITGSPLAVPSPITLK